jgi:hypothetical protein
MKKFFIVFFVIISINLFSTRFLIQDYSSFYGNKFYFDFDLDAVYNSRLTYNFDLRENTIETSKNEDIFVYFNFFLPDFSISYRNINRIKTKTFVEKNFNGFVLFLDEYIFVSLTDLYIGVIFDTQNFDASYFVDIKDLSKSIVNFSLKNNLFSLSFEFSENKISPFFSFGNIFFSIGKNGLGKVYFLSEEFYLYFDKNTDKFLVNSLYFDYKDDSFRFRLPVTNNLFFLYTNLGLGISFFLPL